MFPIWNPKAHTHHHIENASKYEETAILIIKNGERHTYRLSHYPIFMLQ